MLRNTNNRGLANNDNTFTSPVYAFAYTPAVFDLRQRAADGSYIQNPIFGGGSAASNPFQTYQYLKLTEDVTRGLGSATLSYTAVDAGANRVVLAALGGFDRYTQSGVLVSPGFLQYEGADGFFGRNEQTTVEGLNQNVQGTVTWTVTPVRALTFATALGASAEKQSTNQYALLGKGTLPGTATAAQGNLTDFQAITAFDDQALFASEQVTALGERLVLNGGVRADRSSANGDPGRYYVYPRVSGAYRFLNLLPGVEEIKVRGGWGETGNRPPYGARDQVLSTGPIIGGLTSTVANLNVGDPAITPEILTEIEGGADVTGLGGRLHLEATGYQRTITNLLLQPTLAPTSGFTSAFINGGELQTRGIEVGVTGTPVRARDWSIDAGVSFERNREHTVSLPASVAPFAAPNNFGASFGTNRIQGGTLTTAIWGNVPVDAAGRVLPVGSYVTRPGLVAATKDTIIGDANPRYTVAFNNTVHWRAFDLAFTLDWRNGGDVANTTMKLYDEGGTSRDWTTPVTVGDRPAGLPAGDVGLIPSGSQGLGNFRYLAWHGGSDARLYLQDGTNVRVRDIRLSYSAPAAVARAIKTSSLRFSLEARNPFLWTHYWSYDPEFNNFGDQNLNRFIDTAPFPAVRSFTFQIDLGLSS